MAYSDLDMLYRAVQSEAGGESDEGMRAVAHVIMNRANSEFFPSDISKVILQPAQFSAFNKYTGAVGGKGGIKGVMGPNYRISPRVKAAVDDVIAGNSQDPTGGALNYYNPKVASPRWGANMSNVVNIGNHRFGTAGGGAGSTVSTHGLPKANPFRAMVEPGAGLYNPLEVFKTNFQKSPAGRLAAAFGRSLPPSTGVAASSGDTIKDHITATKMLEDRGMSPGRANVAATGLRTAFSGSLPRPRPEPPTPVGAPRPRPQIHYKVPQQGGLGVQPMPNPRPQAPANLLSALFGRMFG